MNPQELSDRLRAGENLHTEFKEWPINSNSLAAEVVAFANTDGGEIFLGIDDNGTATGLARSGVDAAARTVDNVAYNNCEPPVTVVQETVAIADEQVVLIVHVPKGDQRPYRTNTGIYYIRTSSGRRHASRGGNRSVG